MTQYRQFTAEDAMRAAEAALSRSAGGAVAVGGARALSGDERRNLILRASAIMPGGLSVPIIIKASRAANYDCAAVDAYEALGLVKEWAASTVLARRAAVLGRRAAFLAGDIAAGVLVFEDLGEDLASLVQPLLRGSPAEAERALTAYAVALAELHAGTIGCEAEHAGIVRAALPDARIPPLGQGWGERVAYKVASMLGGGLPEGEVLLMAGRLQAPGPWLALAHRDPCPDNVLLTADGSAKLIDFEFSGPGHALVDAAYWRMGFPTCWCAGRVPEDVQERVDLAYRAALGGAVPAALEDDAFRRESAIIAVVWLFGNLAWLLEGALKDDGDWGISTRRSRILYYLEVVVGMTAAPEVLPGTCQMAAAWLDDLRSRWPGCLPLAHYPAFRTP